MKYKLKSGVLLDRSGNYSGLHPAKWSTLNGGGAVELTEEEARKLEDKCVEVTQKDSNKCVKVTQEVKDVS